MSVLCCGCLRDDDKRKAVAGGGYLLPGGEWDPSLYSPKPVVTGRSIHDSSGDPFSKTNSSVRSFLSRKLRRKRSSLYSQTTQSDGGGGAGEGGRGDYQPPPLVPSKTLPTFEEFKLLKTVGKGAFGKVMMAVHIETRILYALKVVPKSKIVTKKQVEQIISESHILKSIRHPFCISLQYAFQNDNFLFYVFEFAAGGMLFYHLGQEGKFCEPRARFYFGEIVLALDYLHSLGIIFRDLKPENCMLSEKGHIVLTDFGCAKMLQVAQKTSTIAGTPQYIAPEVLRGEPYSFSADWWSSGILLYEMLTGKVPFFSADRVELYRLVLRGYFTIPRGVSLRAKALLFKLINGNQDERIGCPCGLCQYHSASAIKQHSFFSQTVMEEEEEEKYMVDEAARQWEKSTQSRHIRSSRNGSFLNKAESFIRSVSVSATSRVSGVIAPYKGEPCEWTWEGLECRNVVPPFKPMLAGPTDLRHFDPILTCIPPTLSDLVTTERSLHVEDFNYVCPDGNLSQKNTKKRLEESEGSQNIVTEASAEASKLNSTDEEKVKRSPVIVTSGLLLKEEEKVVLEGECVEEQLETSSTPLFVSNKIVVAVDVNPNIG